MGEAKTHKNTSPQTTKPWTATGKHCINESGRILGVAIIMQVTALAGNSSKPRAAQCFHGFLTGELQANCSWNVLSKSLTAFMSSGFTFSKHTIHVLVFHLLHVLMKCNTYIYIYILWNTAYILPVYCIQHTHVIMQMFSIAKVHKEYWLPWLSFAFRISQYVPKLKRMSFQCVSLCLKEFLLASALASSLPFPKSHAASFPTVVERSAVLWNSFLRQCHWKLRNIHQIIKVYCDVWEGLRRLVFSNCSTMDCSSISRISTTTDPPLR